ncbi:MAG TPA: hypothetical protein VF627_09145 [Abditibacterium sp.]|jgi:hypothetical protein
MKPPLSAQDLGDSLHRTLKLLIDEGEASSIEEAQKKFESFRLRLCVGANIAASATRQAMLLTAVNTGARCFLGGVQVELTSDAPLLVPCRDCQTVGEAIQQLGGKLLAFDESRPTPAPLDGSPVLLIGDYRGSSATSAEARRDGVLRLSFEGWCAAVTPLEDEALPENREWTLAGVLAGALGVSEAFQFVRGKNWSAGARPVALSLWKPELDLFCDSEAQGPVVSFLPAAAWIIGLGHLGQAYLWALGMLPYTDPQKVQLVLQDDDRLQPSNLSTSILTREIDLKQWKTRAMAEWCEERGFEARIHERRFAADFRVQAGEPKIALCGVDNPQARAVLEEVGFDEIIEAGLGSRGEDYLSLRLHGFAQGAPSREARAIWGDLSAAPSEADTRLQNPIYSDLEERGLDVCGLTTLAGRAVGASFVGTVAATFCIAEMVRLTMNAHRYALLELCLRNPQLVTTRLLPPVSSRVAPYTGAL